MTKGRKALSLLAGAIICGLLLSVAVSGVDKILLRQREPAESGELLFLECLKTEVERLTKSGQLVRLDAGNDPYLIQRIAELSYPRIDLVEIGEQATLIVRSSTTTSEDDRCGVTVELKYPAR